MRGYFYTKQEWDEFNVKTYIFRAEVDREEDGRWSSWIKALPGYAAWGYSREQALDALKDAAEAYFKDITQLGDDLPKGGEGIEAPVITVTV